LPPLAEPAPPAPDHDQLALSWRRSESCGLTPQSARPGTPGPEGRRARRLAEAAGPVLDELDSTLRGTGATLLLADRSGQVVRTVRDAARVTRMLLRRGIDDGAILTEDAVGNNGIGTALETRAGVFIHGDQHFAEVLRDFSCYGHPVIDPLTRRIVGAVNLSGLNADASRLFAPFVRTIVAEIEARYVDTAGSDDRELWRRFVERTRTSESPTCAFGDEVVLASNASLERLGAQDIATLRRMVDRGQVADAVDLSVGRVGITASRVGRRGHLVDLSFPDAPELYDDDEGRHRRHARRSRGDDPGPIRSGGAIGAGRREEPAARPQPSTTVPSQAAASSQETTPSQANAPARTQHSHAVVGPAGSGRSTTAVEIAGSDAVHVRLAGADDARQAWRDLAAPALRELREQEPRDTPAVLILDDIDLLADADLRRLASRLGSMPGGVVVTSRDNPRPAVTEVLDVCGARTTVRPLHERGAELEGIVCAMVEAVATALGTRAPAVTPRFLDAVSGLDLPNGLVSLRGILTECLDGPTGRGARRLDVDDLPSRARAGRPPTPGELARGEYDAIVAALAECNGVRSRAAKRLGISRTTLYARMREFDLS